MPNTMDLRGRQFNFLTAQKFVGHSGRDRLWECLCICGKIHRATTGHLTSGHTKSCGCYERTHPSRLVHGHNRPKKNGRTTPTYNSWYGMKTRCMNPNNTNWKSYGARGIKVCERWLHSFPNFLTDMGEHPKGTTLGRFGDQGDYEPGNVKWMTKAEQVANRRPDRPLSNVVNNSETGRFEAATSA